MTNGRLVTGPCWQGGRREVKAFEDLSPRAQKAVWASQSRQRRCLPTVARGKTGVVVIPPLAYYPGSTPALGFAKWANDTLLPLGFRFNVKRGWWEAPLAKLPQAIEALNTRESGCKLSQGVEDWLKASAEQ